MGIETFKVNLSGSVAAGGTFLVPYPSGMSATNYVTTDAKMVDSAGNVYDATVLLGAGGVTVTNPTGRVIGQKDMGHLQLTTDDVGPANSDVIGRPAYYNAAGTALVVNNEELPLARSPIENIAQMKAVLGFPQSGTIGANGALTLNAANNNHYLTDGVWWYFPANAVFSGSPAGFYWTVMTTNLLGTVYANYQAVCDMSRPTTLVPLSGTTGAAYTPPTSSATDANSGLIPAWRIALPDNVLSEPGDMLEIEYAWDSYYASAANKYYCMRCNGDPNIPASYIGGWQWNGGSSNGGVHSKSRYWRIGPNRVSMPQGWNQLTDSPYTPTANLNGAGRTIGQDIRRAPAAVEEWQILFGCRVTHYPAAA